MADVQDEHRREALAALVQHGLEAGVYDVAADQDFLVADIEQQHVLGCPMEHLHRVPDCCSLTCWCRTQAIVDRLS